ncbi:MAG: hypothetical protein R6U19_00720 [Bacteroidales bacterium]
MANKKQPTDEPDRIRQNTIEMVNQRIDQSINNNIRYYGSQTKEIISKRIKELDMLWDIDRIVQAGATGTSFTTLLMGAIGSKNWWFLTATSLSFLGIYSVHGWAPSVCVLRSLGIRTRQEIEREKYALKALRGDFDEISTHPDNENEKRATAAIKATESL